MTGVRPIPFGAPGFAVLASGEEVIVNGVGPESLLGAAAPTVSVPTVSAVYHIWGAAFLEQATGVDQTWTLALLLDAEEFFAYDTAAIPSDAGAYAMEFEFLVTFPTVDDIGTIRTSGHVLVGLPATVPAVLSDAISQVLVDDSTADNNVGGVLDLTVAASHADCVFQLAHLTVERLAR